jgi:hypothetical protein
LKAEVNYKAKSRDAEQNAILDVLWKLNKEISEEKKFKQI